MERRDRWTCTPGLTERRGAPDPSARGRLPADSSARGRLPGARVADRGRRRGPSSVAAAQPLRREPDENLAGWLTTMVRTACLRRRTGWDSERACSWSTPAFVTGRSTSPAFRRLAPPTVAKVGTRRRPPMTGAPPLARRARHPPTGRLQAGHHPAFRRRPRAVVVAAGRAPATSRPPARRGGKAPVTLRVRRRSRAQSFRAPARSRLAPPTAPRTRRGARPPRRSPPARRDRRARR